MINIPKAARLGGENIIGSGWPLRMSSIVCGRQTSALTDEPSYPRAISVLLMADIHCQTDPIQWIGMQPRDQAVLEVMITTCIVTNEMKTRAITPGDPKIPVTLTLELGIPGQGGILVTLVMTRHLTVHIIQIRNRKVLRILPHLQMKAVTEQLFDHGGTNEVIDQMTVIVGKNDDLKLTDRTIRLIPLTRAVKGNIADDHDDRPIDREELEDQLIPEGVQPERAATLHSILGNLRITKGTTMIYTKTCMRPK
jgi:hypothetical protein